MKLLTSTHQVHRFSFWGKYFLSTDNNVTYTELVSSVFANGITIKLKLCTIATYHPQHRNYAAGHLRLQPFPCINVYTRL
jgi:hypothetical protein